MTNKYLSITNQDNTDFKKMFGFELKTVFDGLYGFDIMKFDELINTPDKISTAQYIKSKYSNEALSLIKKLMDI